MGYSGDANPRLGIIADMNGLKYTPGQLTNVTPTLNDVVRSIVDICVIVCKSILVFIFPFCFSYSFSLFHLFLKTSESVPILVSLIIFIPIYLILFYFVFNTLRSRQILLSRLSQSIIILITNVLVFILFDVLEFLKFADFSISNNNYPQFSLILFYSYVILGKAVVYYKLCDSIIYFISNLISLHLVDQLDEIYMILTHISSIFRGALTLQTATVMAFIMFSVIPHLFVVLFFNEGHIGSIVSVVQPKRCNHIDVDVVIPFKNDRYAKVIMDLLFINPIYSIFKNSTIHKMRPDDYIHKQLTSPSHNIKVVYHAIPLDEGFIHPMIFGYHPDFDVVSHYSNHSIRRNIILVSNFSYIFNYDMYLGLLHQQIYNYDHFPGTSEKIQVYNVLYRRFLVNQLTNSTILYYYPDFTVECFQNCEDEHLLNLNSRVLTQNTIHPTNMAMTIEPNLEYRILINFLICCTQLLILYYYIFQGFLSHMISIIYFITIFVKLQRKLISIVYMYGILGFVSIIKTTSHSIKVSILRGCWFPKVILIKGVKSIGYQTLFLVSLLLFMVPSCLVLIYKFLFLFYRYIKPCIILFYTIQSIQSTPEALTFHHEGVSCLGFNATKSISDYMYAGKFKKHTIKRVRSAAGKQALNFVPDTYNDYVDEAITFYATSTTPPTSGFSMNIIDRTGLYELTGSIYNVSNNDCFYSLISQLSIETRNDDKLYNELMKTVKLFMTEQMQLKIHQDNGHIGFDDLMRFVHKIGISYVFIEPTKSSFQTDNFDNYVNATYFPSSSKNSILSKLTVIMFNAPSRDFCGLKLLIPPNVLWHENAGHVTLLANSDYRRIGNSFSLTVKPRTKLLAPNKNEQLVSDLFDSKPNAIDNKAPAPKPKVTKVNLPQNYQPTKTDLEREASANDSVSEEEISVTYVSGNVHLSVVGTEAEIKDKFDKLKIERPKSLIRRIIQPPIDIFKFSTNYLGAPKNPLSTEWTMSQEETRYYFMPLTWKSTLSKTIALPCRYPNSGERRLGPREIITDVESIAIVDNEVKESKDLPDTLTVDFDNSSAKLSSCKDTAWFKDVAVYFIDNEIESSEWYDNYGEDVETNPYECYEYTTKNFTFKLPCDFKYYEEREILPVFNRRSETDLNKSKFLGCLLFMNTIFILIALFRFTFVIFVKLVSFIPFLSYNHIVSVLNDIIYRKKCPLDESHYYSYLNLDLEKIAHFMLNWVFQFNPIVLIISQFSYSLYLVLNFIHEVSVIVMFNVSIPLLIIFEIAVLIKLISHIKTLKYFNNNLSYSTNGQTISLTNFKYEDHGVYEVQPTSYLKPNTTSYSDCYERFPHSRRFLCFNMRYLIVENSILNCLLFLYSFNPKYLKYGNIVESRLGHQVPWRTEETFGTDALVYVNCGPLDPYVAWQVWRRFSCNSDTKPLMIIWSNYTSLRNATQDVFDFPMYETNNGSDIYSWKKINVNIKLPATMHRAATTLVREAYIPICQNVRRRNQTVILNNRDFVNHYHSFRVNVTSTQNANPLPSGDRIVKLCKCDANCTDPIGSYNHPPPYVGANPTHGLFQEDWQMVMGHISIQTPGNAQSTVGAFIMTKPSWNKNPSLLPHYISCLMKARERANIMMYDHLNSAAKKQYIRAEKNLNTIIPFDTLDCNDNNYVVYAGKKCKGYQRILSLLPYSTNEDIEEIKDLIWISISKLTMKSRFLTDGDVDVDKYLFAGKNCYGDPEQKRVKSNITCSVCFGYAPLKFKWKKRICPLCTEKLNSIPSSGRDLDASILSFWPYSGLTQFQNPLPIYPANPYYKPKPLLDGLKTGKDFNWKEPGYRLPRKQPPKKVSVSSWLIGINFARRACCLNLFGGNVEENTIRTRLFAKPLTRPDDKIFKDLFVFALKYDLIGPKIPTMRAMPFCPYDFSKTGWLASQLISLQICNVQNLPCILKKMKRVLDALNSDVWKITDWSENTKDNHDQKFWLQGFEPRKKKIYLTALLEMNERYDQYFTENPDGIKYPRIAFSFFLKRELQPHTCDQTGRRSPLNPRVICNPDAWSQIVVGPYLKQATNNLHELWNRNFIITYFGGLSPGDANLWLNDVFNDRKTINCLFNIIIENDFSKFDCTYSPQAFCFLYSIYSHWGIPVTNPLFLHVLTQWERPCGRFRSGLCISGPVMNASGRADTALMNALINGLVQVASYAMAEQNVQDLSLLDDNTTRQMLSRMRIAVLGDDSLTVTNWFGDIEQKVGDAVARFGFEARDMKVRREPQHCVFLAQRPYPTVNRKGEKRLLWGPTIGRKLYKMGTSTDKQPNPFMWLQQTSYATILSAPHVPIIRDVANKQLQLLWDIGVKVNVQKVLEEDSIKWKRCFIEEDFDLFKLNPGTFIPEYSPDPMELEGFLTEVYGISLYDYNQLQDCLDLIKYPTSIINIPWIDRIIKEDTGA